MNDVLGTFDPAAYERDLEYMIGTLSDAGATVLTSTFPDVTRFIPLPARAKSGIRDRLLTANDVVREVATRQKAVWIDAEDLPHELVRWNFSIDFLHPSARGHLLIATAFAAKLSEVGGVPIELPGLGRARPVGRENARHMRWLVTQVGLASMSKTVFRLGARLLPGRSA
jgi:lysophospholipase L1-like esterase